MSEFLLEFGEGDRPTVDEVIEQMADLLADEEEGLTLIQLQSMTKHGRSLTMYGMKQVIADLMSIGIITSDGETYGTKYFLG